MALRQLQQLQPPRRAHGHRGRILVMWRDIDRPDARVAGQRLLQRVDPEAPAIHRHAPHLCPRRAERLPGERIARLLHRDDLARRQRRPHGQE